MKKRAAVAVPSADESEAIARIRGKGPRSKPAGDRINWTGVREEYVTGTETLAHIAKRLGVSERAVEKQASADREVGGKSWSDLREEFREDVARTFRMESAKRQTEEALSVRDSQVKNVADLVDAAMPVALAELANGTVRGPDAVRVAIAALRAQSRVHGLERVAAQVELTGKDGGPIEHDVFAGGGLDEQTAALAECALAAIFGKAADPG